MSATPELPVRSPKFIITPITIRQSVEDDLEEEECRTPTTEESKLPSAPGSCPPAPRKPVRVLSCKRRLQFSDFDHLIIVATKDIEELFQHAKKRRRSLPIK